MIYSNAVKDKFSRAATEYEAHADFQQEVADELLGLIHRITPIELKSGPVNVLDTGCGTGRLMRELRETCEAHLFGLDIALPMLKEGAESLCERGLDRGVVGVDMGVGGGKKVCGLVNGACEGLPFGSTIFGLVISSLAYQWVSDLAAAFIEVERVLRPDGTFVFSTLGPKTLNELVSSLTEAECDAGGGRFTFTPFAREQEIEAALDAAGLRLIDVHKKNLIRRYDTPLALLKTLKSTGASARGEITEKNLSQGTFLKRVIRIYEKRFSAAEGGISATYEVLFVRAKK